MLTDLQKDLMKAIEEGSLGKVQSLMDVLTDSGNNPRGLHFRDEDGNTPLHVATQVGGVFLSAETGVREPLIVKALVEACPELLNLQVGTGSAEDSKWTALHIAAMYRNTDILNYLMAQKARPDLPDAHGYIFTEYIPRQQLDQIRAVYESNYGMPMQVPNNRSRDLWEHHFRVVFLPEFERESVEAISGNASPQRRTQEIVQALPQGNNLNLHREQGNRNLQRALAFHERNRHIYEILPDTTALQRRIIEITHVRNLPLSQRRNALHRILNQDLNHPSNDNALPELSNRFIVENEFFRNPVPREIINANPSSRNHAPTMTR